VIEEIKINYEMSLVIEEIKANRKILLPIKIEWVISED
jgi:hypothetical protein